MKKIQDYELTHLLGTKRKCQYLSESGERCKKYVKFRGAYHGDSEIYRSWVLVEFCNVHAHEVWGASRLVNLPVIITRVS